MDTTAPTRNRLTFASWVKLLSPLLLMAIVFPLAIDIFPMPATVRDAYGYTMTAQRLVADGYYAFGLEPPGERIPLNATVTPGWPLVLAATYAVTGVGSDPVATAQENKQLLLFVMFLLSLGIVAAVTFTGRLFGGDDLGLLAGVLAVAYLPFSWAATVNLAEHLGAALFALALYLGVRLAAPTAKRTYVTVGLLGVVCGLVILVRPNLALWTLAPVAYALIRRLEPPKRLLQLAAAATVGVCLVMAPWWARNAIVYKRFVPLRAGSVSASPAVPATPGDGSEEAPIWEQTGLGVDLWRISEPWTPFLDVLYEQINYPDQPMVEYPSAPHSIPLGDGMAVATLWYHRFLLAFALVSLVFLRRSPRLFLLVMAPIALLLVHWSHLTIRYLYPTTPALVVMAAVGIFAAFHSARRFARRTRTA